MFGQPTPTARRLMKERGISQCEVQGCNNPAEEAHHCLYGKKGGKHPVPELNMDENLQLVCRICHKHSGRARSHENKVYFWNVQCDRYGREHMIKWHDSLSLKVKEMEYA